MGALHDSFKAYFNGQAELPTPIPERGTIKAEGWAITYRLFTPKEEPPYLDFFAENRKTNSRHVRILATGEIQTLENYRDALIFNEETGNDWGKAATIRQTHNDRVTEILQEKGFI